MARLPRLSIPGVPQHIVQRGNNRQACFFCNNDRAFFMNKLAEACESEGVKVHAYVLMSNHVHLLMTSHTVNGISKVMQMVGRNYVRYINTTYQRSGTLWEGRFRSSLVQSQRYLLNVYKYIELNPVRAAIVAHPADYIWSSYQHNAGLKKIAVITPHEEYLNMGNSSETRAERYINLVTSPESESSTFNIRHCLNKSQIYGNDKFRQEIKENLKRRVEPGGHGGDRRSAEFQEL